MPEFPRHVEETVQALADIHREHHSKTPRIEKFVAKTAAYMAQPRFLLVVTIGFAFWIMLNLVSQSWFPVSFSGLPSFGGLIIA